MKVVCISNECYEYYRGTKLLMDEKYVAYYSYSCADHYLIEYKPNYRGLYKKSCFITLEEYRSKRLKELGI
ncbi:MAG: hypothetical protein PHY08_12775 [Candidatus Cloacimonetes bacterium]|nr:hypothetical protein [Candidatus Cloacimonadota bacterium]